MAQIEIGSFEAKNKFSSLLARLEKGDEFIITRRGKKVGKLVPADAPAFDREKARRAADRILKTGKGLSLGGLKIKDLINEGRP